MFKYQFLGSCSLSEEVNVTAKLSNSISGKIECEVQSADLVIHDGSNKTDFMQVGVGRAQFQQMVITLGIVPEKKNE